MIGAIKFLVAVAFPELVHLLEVASPFLQVLAGDLSRRRRHQCPSASRKFLAAVATCIRFARPVGTLMERSLVAGECGAAPAMWPNMEAVLVPLRFVFVLEPVATIQTFVLFLRFVCTVPMVNILRSNSAETLRLTIPPFNGGSSNSFNHSDTLVRRTMAYLSSSGVANFFGFLGQHSHMKNP